MVDCLRPEPSADFTFVDHTQIAWQQVKRTRYLFYQRFDYDYPGPIYNLRHRLVAIPAARYGDQRLHDHRLRVTPTPAVTRDGFDRFGNRVIELEAPVVDGSLSFELLTQLERRAASRVAALLPAHRAAWFLKPTPLTAADSRIRAVARDLRATTADDLTLAEAISEWVWTVMTYQAGVTTVETTAAQALTLGQGMCQDYAHIMIAVCRAVGLPARYISGHMLGEGGSHAWVEVLLPAQRDSLRPVAFDPTNRRRPDLSYITVATGRDYRDVSPTTGSFSAPYSGTLTASKRAGVWEVEYVDGTVVRSAEA